MDRRRRQKVRRPKPIASSTSTAALPPSAKARTPSKVNGKLTLGENTADNGGLVLAYSAYLDRAKKEGIDINTKIDGFTGPQRFYIAYAQNYCENARPEQVRNQVLTDPHSPNHFRANGAIVNQPNFAPAFGCKAGTSHGPHQQLPRLVMPHSFRTGGA